jgi:hypothetical protein
MMNLSPGDQRRAAICRAMELRSDGKPCDAFLELLSAARSLRVRLKNGDAA